MSKQVAGLNIETSTSGPRQSVVLVHGAITPRSLRPLLNEQVLTSRYHVVHYDRRGYDGNAPATTLADMAADAALVAQSSAAGPIHVVGFSIGSIIALRLALSRPELVRSLVLIEPTWVTRPEVGEAFQAAVAPAVAAYQGGQAPQALDHLLRLIDGDAYRTSLAEVLSEDWQASADSLASLYFEHDLPAALPFRLTSDEATSLRAPTLILTGERTSPLFAAVADDVHALMPHARRVVIPGATHNVVASAPTLTAGALVDFLDNL